MTAALRVLRVGLLTLALTLPAYVGYHIGHVRTNCGEVIGKGHQCWIVHRTEDQDTERICTQVPDGSKWLCTDEKR